MDPSSRRYLLRQTTRVSRFHGPGYDASKWTHPDGVEWPHRESDRSDAGLKWPHFGTQSVAVLECPFLGGPGPARRDRGASRDAGADALQLQLLRDGGSPNLGRTAGSKRVIAETWVPDRVRTISPTV